MRAVFGKWASLPPSGRFIPRLGEYEKKADLRLSAFCPPKGRNLGITRAFWAKLAHLPSRRLLE